MRDDRPLWLHNISLSDFNRLCKARVTKITGHWEMIDEENSRDWLEFQEDDGEPFVAPPYWESCFTFYTDGRSLIRLNYEGERAVKDAIDIAAWDKKHARDISEYKRLRAKFGAIDNG